MKTIDGNILKNAIIHGINELDKNKETINALNVFPVPDGDTGTNMTMTANTAGKELEKLDQATINSDIYLVAKAASSGSLRGARGNSGVILSQLFRGFAKGLEGKKEIDAKGLALGFTKATEAAYKAVMKPKEGTILTIAKALSESAEKHSRQIKDIDKLLEAMLVDAHKMLIQTEFMLAELTEAGVVDAGGRGLLHVLEGALNANYSTKATLNTPTAASAAPMPMGMGNAAAHASGDIEFGYCTEMFIDLSVKKGEKNPDEKTFEEIETELLTFLDTIGDSVVLVGEENVVKIHVHTNHPGQVMENSLKYGDLNNLKIENMRLQHEEMVSFADVQTAPTPVAKALPKGPKKPVGILAVASGQGFADIFKDLNVDYIIEGGQTMNPSTESFLDAIEQIHADDIIIMPNNSNIILAAEQAQKMSKKNIHVLITKTVPEGIAAMYAYDLSKDVKTILSNMEEAVKNTKTGQVTYAVKDTQYKNIKIKNGDILCMLGGKIVDAKDSVHDGAMSLIKTMAENNPEFMSIYYGSDKPELAEGARRLAKHIEQTYPTIEVDVKSGGQAHYFYIISAE